MDYQPLLCKESLLSVSSWMSQDWAPTENLAGVENSRL